MEDKTSSCPVVIGLLQRNNASKASEGKYELMRFFISSAIFSPQLQLTIGKSGTDEPMESAAEALSLFASISSVPVPPLLSCWTLSISVSSGLGFSCSLCDHLVIAGALKNIQLRNTM
jgi:hypothetical protein